MFIPADTEGSEYYAATMIAANTKTGDMNITSGHGTARNENELRGYFLERLRTDRPKSDGYDVHEVQPEVHTEEELENTIKDILSILARKRGLAGYRLSEVR